MNRSQIILEARTLMAEKTASASYASVDDVNNWINDGIKDMCTKGAIYTNPLSLTVLNNVSTYNCPWDFLAAKNFLNHNGSPLDLIEAMNVGRTYKVIGVPLFYYHSQSPITLSPWYASTTYNTWPSSGLHTFTYVTPSVANGYMYECLTGGLSDIIEPVWPTTLGTKQTDHTVTWICRELVSSLTTAILYDTPLTIYGGVGTYTMLYSAMDSGLYTDLASPNFAENKHRYLIPYICYRWSIKNRDSQLAMGFYQEYAAGVGLPMPQIEQGGQQGAT